MPFSLVALPTTLATCGTLYLAGKSRGFAKWLLHAAFIILALGLMAHIWPGFNNLKLIAGVKFAPNSVPFTMYLNFDKILIALVIFSMWGLGERSLQTDLVLQQAGKNGALATVCLVGVAFAMNYIAWDPKWPAQTWVWAANNLLLVCAAEEAFFRRYLLGGLKKVTHPWVALAVSSIAFGLAHYKGGEAYVILSSIAGAFYGWSYLKTGRTEAAMLTHFCVNFIHFSLFSYPALAH